MRMMFGGHSMNRKEVQAYLDKMEELLESEPVKEAAKMICRARCALFDRDPHCPEHGRCGHNWEWYKVAVVRTITKPVI